MSATNNAKRTDEMTLAESVIALLRHYLGRRGGLILLIAAILGAGLYLNWGWLVAAGIAPLLLALAPCAVMCALGLCMNKMGNKSEPGQSDDSNQDGDGTSPSSTVAAKTRDEV